MSTSALSESHLSDIVSKPLKIKLETRAQLIARILAEKTNGSKDASIQKLPQTGRASNTTLPKPLKMKLETRDQLIARILAEKTNGAKDKIVQKIAKKRRASNTKMSSRFKAIRLEYPQCPNIMEPLPDHFLIPEVEFIEYDEPLNLSIDQNVTRDASFYKTSFMSAEPKLGRYDDWTPILPSEPLRRLNIPRNTTGTLDPNAGNAICLLAPYNSIANALFQHTFLDKMTEDASMLEAEISDPSDDSYEWNKSRREAVKKDGETVEQFEKRLRKNAVNRKYRRKAKILRQFNKITDECYQTTNWETYLENHMEMMN